jgi:DNA invertase Pin-like site-specific DNA recombinase
LTGANWQVVREFKDVGKSGWDPKTVRPEFEEMMAAVRAGELDVIVVNELSRLTRQGAFEAMKIDEELRRFGVRLVSVQEPFLDTSNAVGQAIFALIAALAKQDSDIKAARISQTKEEIQAVGGRHSATPPFGMKARRTQSGKLVITTLEPDEEFAPLVRELAELALAGHSYSAIANMMNERGEPAPGLRKGRATEARLKAYEERSGNGRKATGVVWRAQTVRSILTHPCIGGYASTREPRGPKGTLYNVIARDETGAPLMPHEGIISPAKWLQVQEAIATRSLKPARKPAKAAPTLLSGWKFLRCGICEGALGQSHSERGPSYYLDSNPVGHGGLAIQIDRADEAVARQVWRKIRSANMSNPEDRAWLVAAATRFAKQHDLAGLEEERTETKANLSHVRESIAQHRAERAHRAWSGRDGAQAWQELMDQYMNWEETCSARLADIEERAAETIRIPSEWFAHDVDPLGPEAPWGRWDVYQRREFLALFLTGVSIKPSREGGGKSGPAIPDAERVVLDWRPAPLDEYGDAEAEIAPEEEIIWPRSLERAGQ